MAAAAHWRRHRWTALRSLLLVALLHRLHCLAFLAASSPVWLLAAFLLGVVLVHSEPNVPLAAASEDEDRHLYKKIRHLSSAGSSSAEDDSADDGSSATSSEDHLVGGEKEEEEEVVKAAVAWTADDEHSIQSIGSLELERDARLEKLMSRRSIHRNLIDLDVHIPAVLTKNPFDLHHHHHHCDDTGSAPSFLLGQHSNPFDFPEMQMRRHESFTAGAAARPSRFRPYFVADVPEGGGGDATGRDNSNSSSSTSSSAASDHHLQAQQQAAAVKVEDEAPAAPPPEAAATSPRKWGENGMVAAVDVELISDSSDDDMSLPGDGAAAGSLSNPPDEDEEDSFEVESITQQVAAAGNPHASAVEMSSSVPSPSPSVLKRHATISSKEWVAPTTLASVEENERREREHHILGPVPVVIDDSPATVTRDGSAAGAVVAAAAAAKPPPPAAAPPPPAAPSPSPSPPAPSAAPAPKPSSKSKATSKKAVFGFFRK
ncbi:hypothetical protein SETIT_9G001400v2 [Setaria italica]|uniref:Uncharacterized protein n=1 Tax=Setaria italica TaxID=4555 RepID=A0A368SDD4_SETIT|nr:hypothetical protein SETIT_9G001400v2 [Setaria italica]